MGRHANVSATITRIIPVLAAAGLSANVSKFGFLGSADHSNIRVGQFAVFDRGEPVNYLGYPIARKPAETRNLIFARALSYCRLTVPKLYTLKYMQAVNHINQQLAPRIAYMTRVATFTQSQLDQLDATIVRVLQRHPGKCHAGTMSKGALFAVLRVQLPSMVAMRSRVYFLNAQPPIKCNYLTRMNLILPLTRPALKAAMNAYFYVCYTAKWMASRSGEMARCCPPIVRELRHVPEKRRPFALAFLTNTLPTAHTMHRLHLHSSPRCVCGRGACTSRHILKWHAKMQLKRINWKELMRVCRSLVLRLPK